MSPLEFQSQFPGIKILSNVSQPLFQLQKRVTDIFLLVRATSRHIE